MKDPTKAEELGKVLADAVMKSAHMTYNASRGRKIVETCIRELQQRIEEIQPKKAGPAYKKARYGPK
ncbi:MAG: hypothetical protein U9P50_01125 [Patescibacteria group bacterium]|nr:hypothetical protein [Patescibacteria group bacterium]